MQALKDAIKVIDSDGHARDMDEQIRGYLPEPFRNRKGPYLPRETFDRNLGGTLGHDGVKLEERLGAMDTQPIDTAVLYPTSGLGTGRIRARPISVPPRRASNPFI